VSQGGRTRPAIIPEQSSVRGRLQVRAQGPPSTTRPNAPQRPHSPSLVGRTLLQAKPRPPPRIGSRRRAVMAPSSSSASAGSHAGLAIAATAMALSGTLVLFSICRAKQPPHLQVPSSSAAGAGAPSPRLRPCLSSSEKRKKREKARRGGEKRVRFADDVVDNGAASASSPRAAAAAMPANREALYRGMLRGRSMLRVSCSY
ncbi:hypothetical protein SETIT_4G222200v2, partial [Setaria italica]